MPSMLLLVIGLSANGYAPLTPRPCSPIVHDALAKRRFAAPVSDSAQAACPFVSLGASGARALVVRVYSTGRTADADTRDAERIAGQILRPAGVAVRWLACDRRESQDNGQATCDEPPEPGDVLVRLATSTPQSPAFALGFSYVPGIVATALVDRIHETALRTKVPAPMLLGAVIAHEIAHLLTGSHHADSGLMRAVWTDREIQLRAPMMFRIDGVQRAELRTALEQRNAVRSGALVTGGDAVLITITDALRSRTAGPGP